MASKKKKYRGPHARGSSPVLIGFLAFFAVASFILGLLVWTGYSDKAESERAAIELKKKNKALANQNEFLQLLVREARIATGAPLKATDTLDEYNSWYEARKAFLEGQPGIVVPDETIAQEVKKWMETNSKLLGLAKDAKTGKIAFAKNYLMIIGELNKQLSEAQAKIAQLEREKLEITKYNKELVKKFEDWQVVFSKGLTEQNEKILRELGKDTDEILQLRAQIEAARKKLNEDTRRFLEELRKKEKYIVELETARKEDQATIAKLLQEKRGEGEKVFTDAHPLMLDVSMGRPFWDLPRGKILKVIPKDKKVYINLGRRDGVREEMTFNVFPAGPDGHAYGTLKGTIEVQEVGKDVSMAIITSMYSTDGRPIPLYEVRRGVTQQWSENPFRAGDLLYNLTWKTHVALAGRMNLTGAPVYSKEQELRYLRQAKDVLESQGIIIDAWIDPVTGKIEGKITDQTRFLVLGARAFVNKNTVLDPRVVNPDAFNAKVDELIAQAVKRGLFLISLHNMANVIGYRPPRSVTATDLWSFRPRLPFAGRSREEFLRAQEEQQRLVNPYARK